jgi:hypothetical protein
MRIGKIAHRLTDSENDVTDGDGGSDPDHGPDYDSDGDTGSKELHVLSTSNDSLHDVLVGRYVGIPLAAVSKYTLCSNIYNNF